MSTESEDKTGQELLAEIEQKIADHESKRDRDIENIKRECEARCQPLKVAQQVLSDMLNSGAKRMVPNEVSPKTPHPALREAVAQGYPAGDDRLAKVKWIAENLIKRGVTEKDLQDKYNSLNGGTASIHTFLFKKRMNGDFITFQVGSNGVAYWFLKDWVKNGEILPEYLPEAFVGMKYQLKK